MASLFAKAKTISAPPAKKAANKKDEVEISGLEQLAEIDALMKSLDTMRKSIAEDIKTQALDHFYKTAIVIEKRPENFRGTEGIASASIELRKRSTASALNESEIALFEENGIPLEKVVATPKLFGINPIYAEDERLLERVSKALERIVPDDFIVVQEERSKTVVADSTIDDIFARIRKLPRGVMDTVSVIAIKPKLETTDMKTIIEGLKSFI